MHTSSSPAADALPVATRPAEARPARSLAETRRTLRGYARVLDRIVEVPVLRIGLGLDGLIGLIPGLGDLFGVLLAAVIPLTAAWQGAPVSVVARMALNLLIDGLLGAVPALGDLFDFAWQANTRNLRLFEAWLDDPKATARGARRLWVSLAIALGATFIAMGLTLYGMVWVVSSLFG